MKGVETVLQMSFLEEEKSLFLHKLQLKYHTATCMQEDEISSIKHSVT